MQPRRECSTAAGSRAQALTATLQTLLSLGAAWDKDRCGFIGFGSSLYAETAQPCLGPETGSWQAHLQACAIRCPDMAYAAEHDPASRGHC